jgi:CheY-like chemotaxis protein
LLVNNLVYNSGLNNVQKELLDTLKASTNNLIEAVNKIVDISQPDLDKIKINIISFNLFHALESIKMIYSGRKDLSLIINQSPNIQNYLIGDPIKIKQIFLNLVQNILYSGPELTNQIIQINVIPEKETKSDIEIEFIVETSIKNTEGKSIIGSENTFLSELNSVHFANTKKLIEHSGGSLSVTHKGALTIYSFILGFKKDPLKRISEETEKKTREERKSIKLKDANILLVEDNLINQKIVIISLKNMVKNIDVANNGKEALDKFAASKYDLILMDIQMPVMDGIIAAKKIREIELNTGYQTPIIAITANALSGDRESCLAVGMNDYISKPYQIDILFQKMRVLIEKEIS